MTHACQHAVSLAAIILAVAVTTAPAQNVEVETLVPGTPMHGIQGLALGPDGMLYAGAISAQTISRIDPKTGAVEVLVPAPLGEADDLAVSTDGTLAWTAIVAGELRIKRPGQAVQVLATGLTGVNPVAFRTDGRLVVGQLGPVNALFEFDIDGRRPRRLITNDVDQLNSFEFGVRGTLFGPFWQSGRLAEIDIDSGAVRVVATSLGTPSAVSLDSKGRLVSVDYNTGEVRRTDPKDGSTTTITSLDPPLDNLAVGPDDTIYVSDTARSGIVVVDPSSGATRRLVGGEFATPGGLALAVLDGREVLAVADSTGYRFVDAETGAVTRPRFDFRVGASLDIAMSDSIIATTDARLGRVQRINRRTRELLQEVRDLRNPYGVLILAGGDLLVAEYGAGNLVRIGVNSSSIVATGLRGPVGLASLDAQTVLVTENTSGRILRVDLRNGNTRQVATGLMGPEGIAIIGRSDVVVAEGKTGRVLQINLRDGRQRELARDLPLAQSAVLTPEDVGMPTGIAASRDGSIYISCGGDNSIRRIVQINPKKVKS